MLSFKMQLELFKVFKVFNSLTISIWGHARAVSCFGAASLQTSTTQTWCISVIPWHVPADKSQTSQSHSSSWKWKLPTRVIKLVIQYLGKGFMPEDRAWSLDQREAEGDAVYCVLPWFCVIANTILQSCKHLGLAGDGSLIHCRGHGSQSDML